MRHNKTYKKRMTKREWHKKSQIIVLTAFIAGVAIIGYSGEKIAYKPDFSPTRHVKRQVRNKIQAIQLIIDKPTVETQIREIARKSNFKWSDYIVKLAACESSLNPGAVGDSGKSRGLFQIHKGYHQNINDECAFSIECSTKFTIKAINEGNQDWWTCDRIIKKNKEDEMIKI